MRVLMGLCCGLIFSGLKRFDKPGTWSYILSAMSAPFLNTVFFMGWIVLAFYGCDYVQNLVSVKGRCEPLHVRGAAGRRAGCPVTAPPFTVCIVPRTAFIVITTKITIALSASPRIPDMTADTII